MRSIILGIITICLVQSASSEIPNIYKNISEQTIDNAKKKRINMSFVVTTEDEFYWPVLGQKEYTLRSYRNSFRGTETLYIGLSLLYNKKTSVKYTTDGGMISSVTDKNYLMGCLSSYRRSHNVSTDEESSSKKYLLGAFGSETLPSGKKKSIWFWCPITHQ